MNDVAVLLCIDSSMRFIISARQKKSEHIWKIKHPSFSFPKPYWTDRINILTEAAFIIVCPVLNLMYSFVFITKYDEVCEKTVLILEKKHGL